MPDVFDQVPSNTVSPPLTTIRLVAVKVYVHPSSKSFHIDMRAPEFMWEKICAALAVWVRRGFRLRSALWVAYMRLASGSITWGTFVIG